MVETSSAHAKTFMCCFHSRMKIMRDQIWTQNQIERMKANNVVIDVFVMYKLSHSCNKL